MLPTLVEPPTSTRGVNDTRWNKHSQADPHGDTTGIAVVLPDKSMFLRQGSVIVGVGILSALLMGIACGGMTHSEPHNTGEWLLLMIAMMCLLFGLLLLTIGIVAKMKGQFRGQR
jgi:hypothetical protein